jgi:Fe-S cluster assembly iron-binding protein IscA
MLELTPAAARYLEEARRQQGLPDSYGVRVSSEDAAGDAQLLVAFTEHPARGDDVSEQFGTRLFVSHRVARALRHASAAISVRETPDGAALVLIEHSKNGSD